MLSFRKFKRWTRRVLFLSILVGGLSFFLGGSPTLNRDWDGWLDYLSETRDEVFSGEFYKITESLTLAPARFEEFAIFLWERRGGSPDIEEELGDYAQKHLGRVFRPYYGIPNAENEDLQLKLLDNGPWMVGYVANEGYPLWVAYTAIRTEKRKSDPRPDEFLPDRRTRSRWGDKVAQSSDYTRTGYDRGHLYPNYLASVTFGPKVQQDTFLVSNIMPMTPELNRGIWRELEEKVGTEYRHKYGELFIFTGPVFTTPKSRAKFLDPATREHQIPDAFYKIIVYPGVWADRDVISFVIPQNPQSDRLDDYIVTIDEIEAITEIDFFPALDDHVEDYLEALRPSRIW